MQEAHDPYAALRHRDYRQLLAGGVLSSIASTMLTFAAGWEIFQRTESYAALGALACVGLILPSRPRAAPLTRETVTLQSLLAGIRFVWQTKLLLATLTLDLFAVLLGGATALLPAFAKEILLVGPIGLGWLRAAPSLGAILMAVVLAHRPPLRRAGRALLWSVAGFGAATVGFGLSRDFTLSFVLLAL